MRRLGRRSVSGLLESLLEACNQLIAANAVMIFLVRSLSYAVHDCIERVQTDCEDARLVDTTGRKRCRSEPSALNELNNKHNYGNNEEKMNQAAANVADKAQKPEHH
jgi:hypothetical protein